MAEHRCFRDVKISRTTKITQENKQKYVLEFAVKCTADKKKGKKKEGKKPADEGKPKAPKGGKR